jgi:A/G-specific adenine glycosylase
MSGPASEDLTVSLLAWYERERRDLPWRRTEDPYRILVSETMLQQTQVARVVPRYEAWVARWPTAEALAEAPLAEVLREWVGLGYNRRAVRLHQAARAIAAGGWPDRLEELPGVGPYTAAAVGSFAFGRQVVAVDTNARRVFARAGALQPPPGGAATFNQATMELGARVCTARRPRCEECPLAGGCPSRGTVRAPERRPGAPRPRFEETDRYVRGRVVAALAAAEPLPTGIAAERVERAVAALVRDGLVEQAPDGALALAGERAGTTARREPPAGPSRRPAR